MQRHDVDRGIGHALAQQRFGAADLGSAWKEDQERSVVGTQGARRRLGHLALDRRARVASEVAGLDREGAAGALDHRCIADEPADARPVERRRHDQELEVLAQPLLRVAGERQAEVGVERALVELVEQDGGDAVEGRVGEHKAREHAFGHHLDAGCPRDLGAEPDTVADGRADRLAQRRRHARGGGAGGEPARLEHDDLSVPRPRLLGQHERNPRRLAGAGRRDQDGGARRAQGRGELWQHLVDRQRPVEAHRG